MTLCFSRLTGPVGKCAVAVLLLAGWLDTGATSSPQDSVQRISPVPLTQAKALRQIGNLQDIGNVTIVELDGDYDRGLTAPRQQVAAAFFAHHPDQYDFLYVFTTFEFPTQEATAFYNGLRNDTRGTGQELFDFGADFGSPSKLQGYIDMAAMSRYSFIPDAPEYQLTLDTLAHETMHRWASYVHFLDAHGAESTALLGRDDMHWSYFLNSDASVMYGSDWQLQDDGMFHAVDIRHRYGPLDLYLAGFAAASEIAPLGLIRDGDGASATGLPILGAKSGGHIETITIEQVIAAAGSRNPSASLAQRDFSSAIILLKRPGEAVSPDRLLELERLRVRFEQQFIEMTNGRAVMRLLTQQSNTGQITLPEILSGSGPASTPAGAEGAARWLEARQRDGHWEDRAATAVRDTVAVVRLLDELDPTFSGIGLARAWLANHVAANVDEYAALLAVAVADPAVVIDAQNANGGYSLKQGWSSNAFDTATITSSLVSMIPADLHLGIARQFVAMKQNADGSYGVGDGGRGRTLPTLRAATALASTIDDTYAGARQRMGEWLARQQMADGGVGNLQQTSLAETIEIYSRAGSIETTPELLSGVRGYVTRAQQIQGDWGGSIYLTATAALALVHDQRANFVVSRPVGVQPAQPRDGEIVDLSAEIANIGGVATASTVARWFDGDPGAGGIQIGVDTVVPALIVNQATTLHQAWDSIGRAGVHTIWLVLDADNGVPESSEMDNRASTAITVAPISPLPDFAVSALEFSFDPSIVTTLPRSVRLSGVVHNLGSQASRDVQAKLYASFDQSHPIATASFDAAARSSTPLTLEFTVSSASATQLILKIDPEDGITEASEANNAVSLVLPFVTSLDLEVASSDLTVETSHPTVGQDVVFDVSLHNLGTLDSPSAALHADIVEEGVTVFVYDGVVDLQAGQTKTQRLIWHADRAGLVMLNVDLDPANQIVETSDDNNTAQSTFSVSALDQPDLTFVANSLKFEPSPALQGQPLNASLGIRNLSSVATGEFQVALYAEDPSSGALPFARKTMASIAGISDQTANITSQELDLVGNRTIYAKIDAGDLITEIDETNNIVISPLRVLALPDISISVADVVLEPALPVPGQAVTARVSIRNLGEQTAQNVAVRLVEGSAAHGVMVGGDQNVVAIASGATVTLTWSWTLGLALDSQTIIVQIDPANILREGSKNNNTATLPFDVQSGDLYLSERYISPNGDGVQDAVVIIFRVAQPGAAEIDIVNGAHYIVRHLINVPVNDGLRGQVMWGGRDDNGHLVPDGAYAVIAVGGEKKLIDGGLITVDNNASSVLEAVDTKYGVFASNPFNISKIPPITSPLRDQLFGILGDPLDRGLYRIETLSADRTPVISKNWLKTFADAQHAAEVSVGQFAFSPNGGSIVFVVTDGKSGESDNAWVLRTAVDATDTPEILGNFKSAYPDIIGFAGNDTVAYDPRHENNFSFIDVKTKNITNRNSPYSYGHTSRYFTPYGILLFVYDSTYFTHVSIFIPSDPAREIVDLHLLKLPDSYSNNVDYDFLPRLSPDGTVLAIYEGNKEAESVDLLDLASGIRTNLVRGASTVATSRATGESHTVFRYQIGWLEKSNQLILDDAATRTMAFYSTTGERLGEIKFPAVQRVGDYIGYDFDLNAEVRSLPPYSFSEIASATSDGFSNCAYLIGASLDGIIGVDHKIFDSTTNQYFAEYGEYVYFDTHIEGSPAFEPQVGLIDFFSKRKDDDAQIRRQGTITQLIADADTAVHPLRKSCSEFLPSDWPSLILKDGARIRADGYVQTLSRGVLAKRWTAPGTLTAIWPDETRFLSTKGCELAGVRGCTFSSLLNMTAVLRAQTVSRGIELSGVAADRNFAAYQLDWAPIDHPDSWQTLAAPSTEEVFLDEFLTWVPPQPGNFLIRLTVSDKAGNLARTTVTASSPLSVPIDNFALAPRYFSPNGDGVQDQVVVKYRVRQPLTIPVRISDAQGKVVRAVDFTYGATRLGPQEFDWDGRTENGSLAVDGRYRIDVDGFAAWVTLDTVAPHVAGELIPPYHDPSLAHGCNPGVGECQPIVTADPLIRYEIGDSNLNFALYELSKVGENSWLAPLDATLVSALPGSGSDSAPEVADGYQMIPRDAFTNRAFRIRASDLAGNATTIDIGEARPQLPLLGVYASSPEGFGQQGNFYYQPAPLTVPPQVDDPAIVPIALDRSLGEYLSAADFSGKLTGVAVETASIDQPTVWAERGSYPIANIACPLAVGCTDRSDLNQLYVPLDIKAISQGARVFVRLRATSVDGNTIYSNQGYIQIGGFGSLACDAGKLAASNAPLIVSEYYEGLLAAATIHFLLDGATGDAKADKIEDGFLYFTVPLSAGQLSVSGIDKHGRSHDSVITETNPCVGKGGENVELLRWPGSLGVSPVVRDQCDGVPSEQLQLNFSVSANVFAPPPKHMRVSYRDGISDQDVVLIDSDIDATSQGVQQSFIVGTKNWPEGQYQSRAELSYADGAVDTFTTQLQVVRESPHVEISQPADGQRVCALGGDVIESPTSLAISGSIDSVGESAYRLEIGSGAHPLGFYCKLAQGEVPEKSDAPCYPYTALTGLNGPPLRGPLGTINRLAAYNGVTTIQLKGLNWSGGTICDTSTVYLDSDVQLTERKPPTSPVGGLDQKIAGIARQGYEIYMAAHYFLRADEPVSVTAKVSPASFDSGQVVPDHDTILTTLLQASVASGDIDLMWDGRADGTNVPDGLYGISIDARDDCGHATSIVYGAIVDNAPPAVAFISPDPGSSTIASTVEFTGSVSDEHLISWSLDVAPHGSSNFEHISDGSSPSSAETVLGTWSRGSTVGRIDARLRAFDRFGNSSESLITFELLAPPKLLAGAKLQPVMFSPNGDNSQDSIQVQIVLLQPATVAVHVADRTLFDGQLSAGPSNLNWDGRAADGHVVADGAYPVSMSLRDPNGVAETETQTLTAVVDDSPPLVSVVQPATPFANAAASVNLHFDDVHLVSYASTLTDSGGIVVATTEGSQSGDVLLTPLKDLAEGAYALHARARDAAGNTTVRDAAFVLDATAPQVKLTGPPEAAILAATSPVSVDGSVGDDHLASYSLSVAAQESEHWTELKAGMEALAEGPILAWTPGLPDGNYRLRLRGIDRAGNTTDAQRLVEVDGTPPVAHIASPIGGSILSGTFSVRGSATDKNFLEYRISVLSSARLSSGQWSDVYRGTTQIFDAELASLVLMLSEDEYVVRLTVTDQAGLVGEDRITVRIDAQPPPAPSGLLGHIDANHDAELDWNAVVASDLVGYQIYRGGMRLSTAPIALTHYRDTNASEGYVPYYVTAIDTAGNESAPGNVVNLLIDRTPPLVSIARPVNGERVRGIYDLIGTAFSQNDFKQYRVTLQPVVPPGATATLASATLPAQGQRLASWDTSGTPGDSQVRIHLEGEDTQGNIAVADVEVTVDNTPPAAPTGLVATLVGGDVKTFWNPSPESDLLGYLLYRDSQLVNAPSASLPADLRAYVLLDTQYLDAAIPDGTHNYTLYAIDRAGNISSASMSAALPPIDDKPPSMVIEQPSANQRFGTSVTILANSRDGDLAHVQFAFRPQGTSTWTNFGDDFTETPYRISWTPPSGAAYGTYEVRALAQDSAGKLDPTPPILPVIYADLTAPDAPLGISAHADGDVVHVSWLTSRATDIATYRLYRDGVNIKETLSSTYDDTTISEGGTTYTITAVDQAKNESETSGFATAHVFSVYLDQPYTPTSASSLDLTGISSRPGFLTLHVETDLGTSDSTPGYTAGDIALTDQTLAVGSNHLALRVTDADGNISRPSEIWIDRGVIPAPPRDLAINVVGQLATTTWSPGSESDLLGYRVFRNAHAIAPDSLVATTPSVRGDGYNAYYAVDGDPETYFFTYIWPSDPDQGSNDPTLQLDWDAPHAFTAATVSWISDADATGNFDLYAWSGHAWISIARVRGAPRQSQTLAFSQPYRTARLKLVVHSGKNDGGPSEVRYALGEIALIERTTQASPVFSENLIDGIYQYQVTAVSNFAFESSKSSEMTALVGDVEPPDAVVLTGELSGNTATLHWSASTATDVDHYGLFRDKSIVTTISAADPLTFSDAGLRIGEHAYEVVAYDHVGNASVLSNSVLLVVTGIAPEAPTNLVVTAPYVGGALDISWLPPLSNVDGGYLVRRAASSSGPFIEISRSSAASYHDAPLSNGVTYYYIVESLDAIGNNSPPSVVAIGTPRDAIAPAPPVITYPTYANTVIATPAIAGRICGVAEAGASIVVRQNGSSLPATIVSSSYVIDGIEDVAYSAPLPAPDGEHVALVDDRRIAVVDFSNSSTPVVTEQLTQQQQWAARGLAMYYVDRTDGRIYRWEPGSGQEPKKIDQPVVSITAFAPNTIESTLAIAGRSGASNGIWLISVADGTSHLISGTPQNVPIANISWSPNGETIAAFDRANRQIYVIDVSAATVSETLSAAAIPSWSHDNRRFVLSRRNGIGGDDLIVHDVSSHSDAVLDQRSSGIFAVAWSPADERIAVMRENGMDLLSADDGSLLLSRQGEYIWSMLTWTPSGKLYIDFQRMQVPGWFCTSEEVGFLAGKNIFSATASDASNNHSIASTPIEVDTPTERLPDLAVAASDIQFVPATGSVGASVTALVSLRNTGDAPVDPIALDAQLRMPDGRTQFLNPLKAVSPLPAHASQVVTYALGSLAQSGTYHLEIVADPDGQLREANETNNAAEANFALSADGRPLLEINLDRVLVAPDEDVIGDIVLTNPGSTFNGSVHLSVVDAAQVIVADLGDLPFSGVEFAQQRSAPIVWSSAGIFAGAYAVRAQLFDAVGAEIEQHSTPFVIQAVRHIQLAITTDEPTQRNGANVALRGTLRFTQGNSPLEAAVVALSVINADGTQLWRRDQSIGTLLPGADIDLNDTWPAEDAPAGVYTLRIELSATGYADGADTSVALIAEASSAALNGAIVFSPSTTLIAGQEATLHYRVVNAGASALSAVAARLRVVTTQADNEVLQVATQFDLPTASMHDESLALAAPPLALVSHAAILEVRLSDDPPGEWRLLAQQGFVVVDSLPPTIEVRSPTADIVQPAVVPFRASVVDRHSSVAAVEISIDAGNWQPIGAGADGLYSRGVDGLHDGVHVLSTRARDSWGNQALASPITFIVDATPPSITIGGVADGDIVNHPVTPVVTISDAHAAIGDVRLNGAPFQTETTIGSDGSYVLTVRAADDAGNQSLAATHFTIDLMAPEIVITSPIGGAVVDQPVCQVLVRTEPAIAVAISRDDYRADATSNEQGFASFDAVPLIGGVNHIEATAKDHAGNSSSPASVDITYTGNDITGTIGPLITDVPLGLPIQLPYTLHSAETVTLTALPVRIELLSIAANAVKASDDFTVDLAARGDVSDTRQIATSALVPGAYVARILINFPVNTWAELDSTAVQIVPEDCRPYVTDRIFADDFERESQSADRIFCDGFDVITKVLANPGWAYWIESLGPLGQTLRQILFAAAYANPLKSLHAADAQIRTPRLSSAPFFLTSASSGVDGLPLPQRVPAPDEVLLANSFGIAARRHMAVGEVR